MNDDIETLRNIAPQSPYREALDRLEDELLKQAADARERFHEVERLRQERDDFIEARRLDLEEVERLREQIKYAQGGQYVAVMQEVERLRAEVEATAADSSRRGGTTAGIERGRNMAIRSAAGGAGHE